MVVLGDFRKRLCICLLREALLLGVLLLQGVATSGGNGGRVIIDSMIVPEYVRAGQLVQLTCNWREVHSKFYKITWYKGSLNFYSYEHFYQKGMTHNDEKHKGFDVVLPDSNDRVVTLANLTPDAKGRYKCEVMAEAPRFNTDMKESNMTVVQLPEVPKIKGLRDRYYLPDELNVTCLAENGIPEPLIEFEVNNVIITGRNRVRPLTPFYNRELNRFTSEYQLILPLSKKHLPEFRLVCRARVGHFKTEFETYVAVEERLFLSLFSDAYMKCADKLLFLAAILISTSATW